jgi:Raf kinase inhibitor-like YbhB/YbcL family protein
MKFWSDSFADGGAIPPPYAFCAPDPSARVKLSQNRNPHLAWSDLPKGAQSVVIICHDPDVPSKADDVNQEGRTIPASLPRVNFVHWVLVDMPASGSPIRDGEFSGGVTPKGKSGPLAPRGTRQGINDYTSWFANDPNMKGDYFGYDGPFPPFNDERLHHYHFVVYALDVPSLGLEGEFKLDQARAAMEGHVLDEGELVATYTLNQELL